MFRWMLLTLLWLSPCYAATPITFVNAHAEDYLRGRIEPGDKRYRTFSMALHLMKTRKARTIVETGTARSGDKCFWGDGGSTIIFSHWASENHASLYSVDINKSCIEEAEKATTLYKQAVHFVCDDSLHYLANFPKKIDFLYLDSFDYELSNPLPSQEHHLKEVKAAYDKLTPNSVIMIDDCKLPYGGKGKLAIEYLLKMGWSILVNDYQVILIRS